MKVWDCKVGSQDLDKPDVQDGPMRDAVTEAYKKVTGHEPQFIFSGWDGTLTEYELAVVENREPRTAENDGELLDKMGLDCQAWAQEFVSRFQAYLSGPVDEGLMITWFANAIENGRRAEQYMTHQHGQHTMHCHSAEDYAGHQQPIDNEVKSPYGH